MNDIEIVSTDGSCLESTIGPTGWAWVNHDGSFDHGGDTRGTNQVGELCAVLEALRAHHDVAKLVIQADSEYAIHSSTDWLENWKNKPKKWTNAAGKPISNAEIIQAIDFELQNRPGQVHFEWVKAHNGDHFNEKADQYAYAAAVSWKESNKGIGKLPDEAYFIDSVKPPTGEPESMTLF